MANLNFNCNADCNLIGAALSLGATPREALLAFGKLMRHHYQFEPLSGETVEMYASLMASHLPGPGAGAREAKLDRRRAPTVLKR